MSRSILPCLAILVAIAFEPGAARAQLPTSPIPQPVVPEMTQRSGLISRFEPAPGYLPPDPGRDTFYGTYWDDSGIVKRPNAIHSSGLYGKRYEARDTASYYPYFRGSPGQNTLTPESRAVRPLVRTLDNFVHPWRPVGHYYAAGSYVPIHDLDPLVPGPGPFPWRFFLRRPTGG